jgi:hypothetical protein
MVARRRGNISKPDRARNYCHVVPETKAFGGDSASRPRHARPIARVVSLSFTAASFPVDRFAPAPGRGRIALSGDRGVSSRRAGGRTRLVEPIVTVEDGLDPGASAAGLESSMVYRPATPMRATVPIRIEQVKPGPAHQRAHVGERQYRTVRGRVSPVERPRRNRQPAPGKF